MNIEQIKYNLKNDVSYLVAVIIANNPEAVRVNLGRVYDANVESLEAMANVVMEFYQIGQEKIFAEIMDVPFITANATPELNQAYQELKAERTPANAEGKFADWSGGMFSMVGGVLGGVLGGGGAGANAPVMYPAPPPAPKKDNTIIYIIAGISLLVIGVLAFTMISKKGK